VTLVTLRQALRQLEDDGLLSQQPGRGTFVAEPRAAYRLDSLRGFAEDLRAQGQTVSTQILSQAMRRPPDWVSAYPASDFTPAAGPNGPGGALSGPATGPGALDGRGAGGAGGGRGPVGFHGPAAWFLRLERLRLIAGRPAVHQLSWIRGDELAETDFSGTSLYAALADRGVVVHRAAETVRPGVLDAAGAELLGQPVGTPVFVSDRVTFGLDDVPLVFDRATILGTALEIRTERAVSGLSMQWSRPFS
jgi:GntR family transcriptional regulator